MKDKNNNKKNKNVLAKNIFALLFKYTGIISLLVVLTIIANALTIIVPKIISVAIDTYTKGNFSITNLVIEFSIVAIFIFIFTYLQNIVQVYASERVARDMRNEIAAKISVQPYSYIETATPAKLLTNLTSDVDAVKTFVSMAVSSIISSVFLIIGISILLIMTDWKLGAYRACHSAFYWGNFLFCIKKSTQAFYKISRSNRLAKQSYSESILGAALIRLLNSQKPE